MKVLEFANTVASEANKSGNARKFGIAEIYIIIQIIIALVKIYRACNSTPEVAFTNPGWFERKWIQFAVWRNCRDRGLRAPMRDAIIAAARTLSQEQVKELLTSIED